MPPLGLPILCSGAVFKLQLLLSVPAMPMSSPVPSRNWPDLADLPSWLDFSLASLL